MAEGFQGHKHELPPFHSEWEICRLDLYSYTTRGNVLHSIFCLLVRCLPEKSPYRIQDSEQASCGMGAAQQGNQRTPARGSIGKAADDIIRFLLYGRVTFFIMDDRCLDAFSRISINWNMGTVAAFFLFPDGFYFLTTGWNFLTNKPVKQTKLGDEDQPRGWVPER